MPKFVFETELPVKTLAELCNTGACPVMGDGGVGGQAVFCCPFEKHCTEITPADWQALEVKDED